MSNKAIDDYFKKNFLPSKNLDALSHNEKAIENIDKPLREAAEKMNKRNELADKANEAAVDSLEVLKRIEMNTAYLKDIVDLLNTSNEHQKELNDLVQDILSIAKSPDENEAQSRYRSVMKKIGDFSTVTTSTLNVIKLSSLAATVLQFFMQLH